MSAVGNKFQICEIWNRSYKLRLSGGNNIAKIYTEFDQGQNIIKNDYP